MPLRRDVNQERHRVPVPAASSLDEAAAAANDNNEKKHGRGPPGDAPLEPTGVDRTSSNAELHPRQSEHDQESSTARDDASCTANVGAKAEEDAASRSGARSSVERAGNPSDVMNWAVREGMRRVRSDAVERKMQWLTGVAAIGGFLFGYDTGVIRCVLCRCCDYGVNGGKEMNRKTYTCRSGTAARCYPSSGSSN
jgi:hypothetical protein